MNRAEAWIELAPPSTQPMEPTPPMIFLGYRAKRPWAPGPGWEPIELICGVGEDLCEPPEGWMERWDANRASCYETPEAAWATVTDDRERYRLFAYDFLPIYFDEGAPPKAVPLDEIFRADSPDLPTSRPDLGGMTELGYDIAEKNLAFDNFPMSPLVTSGFAHSFPVNRYGLIVDLPTAIEACGVINVEMPEHAPHWVMRVLCDAHDLDSLIPPS